MIEDIIKNDIKYFLLNPESIKKYILNKSKKSLNNDFESIEFENKKDKINKDIEIEPEVIKLFQIRLLAGAALFIPAIGLSFVNPLISIAIYIFTVLFGILGSIIWGPREKPRLG